MKAATVQQPDCKLAGNISIHAAREGGDTIAVSSSWFVNLFQSTPPVKAATVVPLGTGTLSLYISIHAAREGGDVFLDDGVLGGAYFNPRRP